ncbi:hypothetical protein DBV15_09766 [Temnothorax longispinosus]|uniref:Uncharacterized protein n=1 Tax=Temnothorax longispinosus TaxID=300112 RepID=A0A4S2KIQ2_9HYME|nr:hypothetical protein DBV15_09766 [Temnothorax longispinosus]
MVHLLGGLVTLSFLLINVSFSVPQAELYCSIQRFDRRDRFIVIGTRILVYAHLHLRATETIEPRLVSDVHRLSSIPIVPESRKVLWSTLRSFSSARNRIENCDTRDIASAAIANTCYGRSSSFLYKREKETYKSNRWILFQIEAKPRNNVRIDPPSEKPLHVLSKIRSTCATGYGSFNPETQWKLKNEKLAPKIYS